MPCMLFWVRPGTGVARGAAARPGCRSVPPAAPPPRGPRTARHPHCRRCWAAGAALPGPAPRTQPPWCARAGRGGQAPAWRHARIVTCNRGACARSEPAATAASTADQQSCPPGGHLLQARLDPKARKKRPRAVARSGSAGDGAGRQLNSGLTRVCDWEAPFWLDPCQIAAAREFPVESNGWQRRELLVFEACCVSPHALSAAPRRSAVFAGPPIRWQACSHGVCEAHRR